MTSEHKQENPSLERAHFGLGCFWRVEALFGVQPGVVKTRVGYCGPAGPSPVYPSIPNHTEAVEVDYLPSVVTFSDLLRLFWKEASDCGCSKKLQYMTAVFYSRDSQKADAEKSREEYERETGKKVEAKILPLDTFHEAENYHQKYFLRTYHGAFYEGLPKDDPITSTRNAKLNGFLSGHGNIQDFKENEPLLKLSDEQLCYVEEHITGKQKPGIMIPFARTVLKVTWHYVKTKITGK
ncbi:hypothetical protein JTE90_025159 [Oedothorax gibbosus]|uniref:peptide-methionine (S)-S-oxide reductase n=1 Tax=Oedothorax gibbosus TaxID=931172 RepID=A0AAV6UIH5_9ARAC|nr:hypothetical protein JTE90_025159 [Oedothorax gibbosus]